MRRWQAFAVSRSSPAVMLQDPVHVSSADLDIELLRVASVCIYAKTPASAFPLVTGSLGT